MVNCSTEIQKFHNEKVTLSHEARSDMRERRNANRTKVKNKLNGDVKCIGFKSQGSYAMHTMVQAEGNDFDIDDGLYFQSDDLKKNNGDKIGPQTIKQKIKDAVSVGDIKTQLKKNCVRVVYAKGYHVDIPVYRQIEKDTYYELASGEEWKKSDPLAVTDWFNRAVISKSPDKNNGRQMRRIVRLLKCFVKSRDSWKSKAPSGFIISVLVEECYRHYSERDDLSLYYTMCEIRDRLNYNLEVTHPILKEEKLTTSPDDAKMDFFRKKLKEEINDLAIILTTTDVKEALEAWGNIFDEYNYFCSLAEDYSDDNGSGGGNSGSIPPPNNDDGSVKKKGGGRYA